MSFENEQLSEEANDIVRFLVKQLSSNSFGYRHFIEGAYDAAIHNHGYTPADPEEKDKVVERVIEILSSP